MLNETFSMIFKHRVSETLKQSPTKFHLETRYVLLCNTSENTNIQRSQLANVFHFLKILLTACTIPYFAQMARKLASALT